MALCLGLLGWLYARRRTPTGFVSSTAFLVAAVPLLPVFALTEQVLAQHHTTWAPLMGHRLTLLSIGVFAPLGFWPGTALIGAFATEAVALWYGLHLSTHLPAMVWEPWATLVYAAAGLALLGSRLRSRRAEHQLRHARVEAESLERMAALILALRDAVSTPLQTLEVGTALLRQRAPGCEVTLDAMDRALDRLHRLTQQMASSDPLVIWHKGEESFDADTVLRNLEESLTRELQRRRN
ncbi:hypothetical protein DRW03_20275 [Corallococcus sp. H22C18031201]|nr:hypothetical protein [Citreicoccus inhibens]RJS20265.1 hypothetical protein DRW03_20275 [Corallococcus sp. H22C18031201]